MKQVNYEDYYQSAYEAVKAGERGLATATKLREKHPHKIVGVPWKHLNKSFIRFKCLPA